MKYPNLPLGRSEQDRRVAQTVNYLLNKVTFIKIDISGSLMAASQVIYNSFFPVPYGIVEEECIAKARTVSTNDAVFNITIGGSAAGTITFLAGQTDGTFDFTTHDLEALDDLLITAPAVQDPTLNDITICIAVE